MVCLHGSADDSWLSERTGMAEAKIVNTCAVISKWMRRISSLQRSLRWRSRVGFPPISWQEQLRLLESIPRSRMQPALREVVLCNKRQIMATAANSKHAQ